MSIQLADHEGYMANKKTADAWALYLASLPGGVSSPDLGLRLFDQRIGDAKSSDRLAVSYSTTGAIARATLNALQGQGLLVNYIRASGSKVVVKGIEREGVRWTKILTAEGRALLGSMIDDDFAGTGLRRATAVRS